MYLKPNTVNTMCTEACWKGVGELGLVDIIVTIFCLYVCFTFFELKYSIFCIYIKNSGNPPSKG